MRKILSKLLAVSLVLTATPGTGINANAEELIKMSNETKGGYLNSVVNNRTAGETPDITTGLVGYYGFEDSLNNEASVTGGKAVLHGGAGDTWNSPASGSAVYAESKDSGFGKAYQFSGDTGSEESKDLVRGEGLELDTKMTKTFTISYWVNPDTVNRATSMVFSPVSLDEGLNITDNWGGATFPTVRIWGSSDGESYLDNWVDSADALCGKWSHVTLTCDVNGSYSLYVNGAKSGESKTNAAAAKDLTGMPIFLGINFWDASFDGLMDEVYIYNRALSPEDVKELYDTGKIPTDQIPEPGDTEKPGDIEKPGDTEKPGAAGEPGTDFSKISAQPVVKYTFDNAEGLVLEGEASVTDGVLNLATKVSNNKTYAKIADLSSFDFSNGITLTADVKVSGWKTDWTPIFMLGDGKLGGGKEECTLAYHFTQGFSSRDDVSETGYFGNEIATPYAWDWYNNAKNRNRWDTLTVTINNNRMATYIDGHLVQSLDGDYTKLVAGLKGAKNNYLGASYWPADADFQGSLDNVGIYNTALPAEDISKLTSTKGENVVITTPKPLAPYPVVIPTPEPIVLPTPEPLPTPSPADENATPAPTPELEPETITGIAWWDAANERSRDYVLSGEGTLDLYVTFDSTGDSNGYGAFNVELVSDGNRYITTGSDTNAWTGEQGTGTVTCPNLTNSTIVPGHVYKITVKRTNYDFSIIYYDLTDNKEYCTMEIKDTNQAVDVNVHVIAQVGKYIVSQKAPSSVTPSGTPAPSEDPSASPDPSATAEPGNTQAPGTTDPGTTPEDKDPGTSDPGTNNPDSEKPSDDDKEDKETKKTIKVSDIAAKAGKKKVTGKLSVKGTKVTVKVGSKKYKNAKVNGKKFTFTASSKLKKGTKITVKVTKKGYKTVTKTVKVK